MTAFDNSGIVGHLIMRFTDAEKTILRFGFVIVDDSKRGMGYGKQMLGLALRFAFDILKAQKVTLGVLENNPGANHCYKAAGFKDAPTEKTEYYHLMGEDVKCLELEIEKGFLNRRSSHTGKTVLAQRLLEKHHHPYLSSDHLKMGLIRSGNTELTPMDDDKLTDYLWTIVREMAAHIF